MYGIENQKREVVWTRNKIKMFHEKVKYKGTEIHVQGRQHKSTKPWCLKSVYDQLT